MENKLKMIRTATVPISLEKLLEGQLRFLNEHYNVIGVSSNAEYMQNIGEKEGIQIVAVDMARHISVFKDVKSLWKLYKLFRKEKPMIVHSITPKAGLLSMVAAKMASVPIRMHTFTGLIFPTRAGFFQKLLIWMDRLLCKCATNIYPEGNGVKADLISYKITSKPLKVLANGNINGINTDDFSPKSFTDVQKEILKKEIGIKPNDFVFIFIGRLVGDKGINELIKAFDEISNKYDNVKLILVGPQEKELDPLKEETINTIAKNKNIISVGFQNDVRPFLAISDVLTFPSYREGFPNVVMQAGAMEIPSIVTDINGSNEIIVEGENGTIIPIRDEMALIEKMVLLLSDKEYFLKLKANARRMIIDRYQRENVWQALLEEYQLLEKNYVQKVD